MGPPRWLVVLGWMAGARRICPLAGVTVWKGRPVQKSRLCLLFVCLFSFIAFVVVYVLWRAVYNTEGLIHTSPMVMVR